MSNAVRTAQTDDGSVRAFARALIPIVIAAASVALVVVAIRSHAVTMDEVTAAPGGAAATPAEPTDYSAMEARIPQPEQTEEPPVQAF